MTIGIYALTWELTDKVYVGLSSRIEQRFLAHLNTLSRKVHDNFKVQEAYHKYGTPSLLVLEECSIKDLASREISWIKEFDSINNGFNIIEGGDHSFGCNHTTSQYSKIQILKVFSLLAKTDLTYKCISERTKVAKGTIATISQSRNHTWLKDEYPEMYTKATRTRDKTANFNRAVSRKNIGTSRYSYVFTSPEGKEYSFSCISTFCREIGVFSNIAAAKQGFSRIIHGHRKDYFGWTCLRSVN